MTVTERSERWDCPEHPGLNHVKENGERCGVCGAALAEVEYVTLRAVDYKGAVKAFERVGKLTAWIERDRREPDKVIAYAQELASLAIRGGQSGALPSPSSQASKEA